MTPRPLPIVTARGIARFDILRERLMAQLHIPDDGPADQLHYFRGIKTFLATHGYTVYHTSVGWADSIGARASQLAEQIREILRQEDARQVHLIGHSMGGLDARWMLVHIPEMAPLVALLTTIGAPHSGTPVADLLLGVGRGLIQAAAPYVHLEGIEDLTRAAVAQFNTEAEDQEAKNPVMYQTYASAVDEREHVFLPLQPAWMLLQFLEGENDGLVSVASQAWKGQLVARDGTNKVIQQHRFPFPADHLNQCGWWDPNEERTHAEGESLAAEIKEYESRVKQVYLEIAQSL